MELIELIKRCLRLLQISRKPTDDEFHKVAKVTGMGIIAIGILGLIISVIFSLI